MLRSYKLALAVFLFSRLLLADDQALWREYGLLRTQTSQSGKLTLTRYQMKDLTGALAAWEWLRSPNGRPCDLATFCTEDGQRVVVFDDNYVLVFDGGMPQKAEVDRVLKGLPGRRDTSLPAILTFLPRNGLVPDSARYVLGQASLHAFAPELAGTKPGFDQEAEAQVAQYALGKGEPPVHLALFDYPTPEMARLHLKDFQKIAGLHVKRSGKLLAIVFGSVNNKQADTLLSRVEYEAKITWNETPPISPIKPLYTLFISIIYISIFLSVICLMGGLAYAGMRLYRRRYGQLAADEAMVTLHLTGD